jgi:2,5-dihydroxypyridine 5,6-dioxygenase
VVQFPISPLAAAEAFPLFRWELELCRLEASEQVLIVTDPMTNPSYVTACLGAALSLGAEAVQVVVPLVAGLQDQATRRVIERPIPYRRVLDMMKRMDLVADLTSRGFLHSEHQVEMLSEGMRMLRVREPVDNLRRLFPTHANQARVEASARLMEQGRRFEVTTEAGTDLVVERGDRRVFMQYGYAERPGRWDHWPTALTAVAPLEESAHGTIVLRPGDWAANRYITSPVRVTVREGRMVEIGGGKDAMIMQDYLAREMGSDADRISHIGWGCDPRAKWDALDRYRQYHAGGAEARSVLGGVVIAFGSNADMGGANRTQLHMDLGVRGTRLSIDGRPILESEQFVAEELLAIA